MDILEAQFRAAGGRQWQVRLVPRKDPSFEDWRDWEMPESHKMEEQLLASLFNTDSGRKLLNQPWHLRLQAEHLGENELGGIPSARWSYLVHPDSRCHILDIGWTVTEMVGEPLRGNASGDVAVVGNPALAASLRKRVGPVVHEAPAEDLPRGAIVVLCGPYQEDAARAIAKNAWWDRGCPLLIWCGAPPPRVRVPCIFPASTSSEPDLDWLTRLLVSVLWGVPPVEAFAAAGFGRLTDRFKWLMRGAHDEWAVSRERRKRGLHKRWYVSLDRAKQEKLLNDLVAQLLNSRTRRVQLVVTPGVEGAGLDLFRRRPLHYHGPVKIVEWDFGWADNAANTIELLRRKVGAERVADIGYRLQEEASRYESGALFWIRHDTASLAEEGMRQVTRDELTSYRNALQKLARDLVVTRVQLLVHVSVVASSEELAPLKGSDDYYRCDVLNALGAAVAQDELRDWLDVHDLPFTAEDLGEMSNLTYDELIDRIVQRFPYLVED